MGTGPTLKDVADSAGVSQATASRALMGGQSIAEDTRTRVLSAAEQLGYRGRRRHEQAANAPIVVLAPSVRHLAVAEVLAGIEEVSSDAGHSCTFAVTGSRPEREIALLDQIGRGPAPRALIAVGGTTPTPAWRKAVAHVARTLSGSGVPVVFCGRALPQEEFSGVAMLDYDNRGGAEAAVSTLLSRGHRNIGLIRGPIGFTTSDERALGHADALTAYGLAVDPGLIAVGPRSATDALRRTTELLEQRPDVTAVFADSDSQALGSARAAHLKGLVVPDDLSVVGFDDEAVAAVTVPTVTTVHTPFIELGRRAARGALGMDPELRAGGRVTLATHVVLRESVSARRQPVQ